MQILKVEITGYISLSKSMSLRDELVENERAASDPLVRVIFRAKMSSLVTEGYHRNLRPR